MQRPMDTSVEAGSESQYVLVSVFSFT